MRGKLRRLTKITVTKEVIRAPPPRLHKQENRWGGDSSVALPASHAGVLAMQLLRIVVVWGGFSVWQLPLSYP